ncbi:hypothetical protein [Pollutibacter soli]|uniref:hypothetical protein n=1 Tax=Pollutibacter soli TaxID=3034157 RepID=UPI003013D936
MAKEISRFLLPFQEGQVFSAMRDKIHYAKSILYVSRFLLLKPNESTESSMKLVVGKMSRIFIFKQSKFLSFAFPLFVDIEKEEVLAIRSRWGVNIDSEIISKCFEILNDENFLHNPSLTGFYFRQQSPNDAVFNLLEEIIMFEPCYIRYDFDKERANGRRHPLYHLDVNYSDYGNFKMGLDEALLNDNFEDILNIETDCAYLQDAFKKTLRKPLILAKK